MQKKRVQEEIRDIVFRLKLRPYDGTPWLVECWDRIVENEDLLEDMMVNLFVQVAEKHGTTIDNLYRNFRTIVDVCWQDENREYLNQLIKLQLTERPSVVEFVTHIATYLLRFNEEGRS